MPEAEVTVRTHNICRVNLPDVQPQQDEHAEHQSAGQHIVSLAAVIGIVQPGVVAHQSQQHHGHDDAPHAIG